MDANSTTTDNSELTELERLKTERITLFKTMATLETEKTRLNLEIDAFKANIEQLTAEKQELANRVADLEKEKLEVSVADVTNVFKNTLQSLQREVREPEGPGELGYMVDKFEVELKSGLDLKEGIKLVQPTAAELKPEGLSTIRMSFKAKPKLKITEE